VRAYLLATTGLFAACAAHAQCQAPAAAQQVGYTTQTLGGSPANWLPSSPSGTGTTRNPDGSVTIANPTNNNWGGQLQTWNNGQGAAFGGGFYTQATLKWDGNYVGGQNGTAWPAFWADGQEAMANKAAHPSWIEPDFMEAWNNSDYSGTLHDWLNGGATNIQTSSGGIDPGVSDQKQTYGFRWIPATAITQGSAQWFLNGRQVGKTVTWNQGQGPYASMDAQHFALFLGTGMNPMTVYDVQVWQNPATANNIGASPTAAASGCAPVQPSLHTAIEQAPPAALQEVTPGQGAIASNGNAWSVSADGHAMVNDTPIPGGGGTSAIEVVAGVVWGQDNGKSPSPCPDCWFTLSADGQNWTPMPGQSPFGVPVSPSQPTPSSQPQPPVVCGTKTPGSFRVNGGQIVGPNGRPFIARGINLRSTELSDLGAVLAAYPGLNFLRLNIRNLDDPSSLQSAVDQLTARGTVVELEVHPNGGGGQGSISELSGDGTWYAQAAAYFRNNAYVWFGTYNEPPTSGGSLSAWHKATYQAIRGAGNNAPILIEPGGSRPWNLTQALDPSAYVTMTNIVMDPHVYGYQTDYNTDQATNDANVKAMVAAAQTIRSADGSVPAIIGEYGDSTDGSNTDPNGTQNVEAVINSGFGSAAWSWISGGSDMLQSGGTLTEYGQRVALLINTSVIPCSQGELNAQAQQSIKTAQATALAQQQQPTQQASPESTPPTDPSSATANAQAAALIAQADALIQQAQTATAPTDAATQALIEQANANLLAAHQ
jgi:hypothetical protein